MSVTIMSVNGIDRKAAEEIALKLVSTGRVANLNDVQLHMACQANAARSWFVKADLTNEAYYAICQDAIDNYFELLDLQFYAGNIGPSYFSWLLSKQKQSTVDDRTRRTLSFYGYSLHMTYRQEADFLKKAEEFCSMIGPSCLVVREAAATRNGVSDLLLCYRGRFIACELKRDNGEPSIQQLKFIEKVKAAGGSGGVCKCLADIWELMDHTAP